MMKMQLSKNFLLAASAFVSIVGILVIYIASLSIDVKHMKIIDITSDLEGRKVQLIGEVTERHNNADGHIFLTVSDKTGSVQIPIFADLARSLDNVGITSDDFKKGSKISVTGFVEIYKGKIQLTPHSVNDIKILGE